MPIILEALKIYQHGNSTRVDKVSKGFWEWFDYDESNGIEWKVWR